MKDKMYTAEQLGKMSEEELENILNELPPFHPTIDELRRFDVGIYDKDGNLIGDKEGDEY